MSELTKPLESATRKKIDLWLTNLGWNIDEESPTCNVVTERGYTEEQKEKLQGNQPDYLLIKTGTTQPLGVIETKRIGESLEDALDDAIEKYAKPLDIPIAFATDGTFTLTWHMKEAKELSIDSERVKGLLAEEVLKKFVNEANIRQISEKVKHTRDELIKVFKWANDLLRKEGLRGLDRFVEFSNILFLKLISEIESDRIKNKLPRLLADKYCWDAFANLPSETMLEYVNNTVLKHLVDTYNHSGDVFQEKLQIKDPNNLKLIVDKLSKLQLINTDSDIKGDAFEYFLKSLGSSNDLGEYFTPRHIVKVMVKLVDPKFGEKVYDSSCGTGGFIIEAYKHIRRSCKLTSANMDILKNYTIYASELTNTARIAKMNMILADDGHTNIKEWDSLAHPVKAEYDVVLTNFPFSQDTDYSQLYGFNTKDGNVVFLKHIIDSLKDRDQANDPRAGVVTFQGVLYDSEKVYQDIRKYLLENCEVEAVIKLHNYVFRPYSGANTSILIFRKGRPTKKVWFFVVDNDGFEKTASKKGRRPIPDNDLDALEKIWQTKPETVRSWTVDLPTIKANKYSLDANLYKPRKRITARYPYVPILDVCDQITEPVAPFSVTRKYLDTGNLVESEIKGFDEVAYENKQDRANQEVSVNDVIFAKMEMTNKSLLITEQLEDIIVSTGFVVLRAKDPTKELLPEFLYYWISSEQFLSLKDDQAKGSTQRAINSTEGLPKLQIPLPPFDVQKEIVSELKEKTQKINAINQLLLFYASSLVGNRFFSGDYPVKALEALLLTDPQNGLYKNASFYTYRQEKDGIPIVRIDNIYDCELVTKNIKSLRLTEDEKRVYQLKKDDILLNRVNSEDFIGKSCVYEDQFPVCVFESNMMRFSVDQNKVLPKYVVYYLSSPEGKSQIISKSKPSVNQVSVNQVDVKSILIPVPEDLKIQEKIVSEIGQELNTVKSLQEIKQRLKNEIQERMDEIQPQ
jgi:type I restriction enzyme M protein